MLKHKALYQIAFLSVMLNADAIDVSENNVSAKSVKNSDIIKFAINIGAKTDYWDAGLQGNVLDYDTEGILLGVGKLKVKIYDSDVFTIERYRTLDSSDSQDDLLAQYQSDKKQESTIDGMKISLGLMKIINYLFKQEWLEGLNYNYNTRNFIGSATLLQNSVYWFGKTDNGILGEDFVILEKGNDLSFKTKFTSHRLSYRFDSIFEKSKGPYFSVGVFDQEWSKPTFVGDVGLNGELPVIFDSNYYSKGVSGSVGSQDKHYDIKAYFDYGLDNEMKIIQQGGNYADYNNDVDMYTLGFKADYRFVDVYTNSIFATDIIIGAGMQYNQITQDGDVALDAETLYGVNTAIEIIF